MWWHVHVIWALGKLRKNCKFKASLDHIARLCLWKIRALASFYFEIIVDTDALIRKQHRKILYSLYLVFPIFYNRHIILASGN